MSQQSAGTYASDVARDERVAAFLNKVYSWMFLGLGLTAAVAYGVASSPTLVNALISNQIVFLVVLLAPIIFVVLIRSKAETLSPPVAATLFATYAALNGVTFSVVLLAYTATSVASTFLATAGAFGGLALYGTFTKRSLSGVGQFAVMGLFGLLIMMLVSFFVHRSTLEFVITVVGIVVFTCLTAYRAQELKSMALALPDDKVGTYSIVGALGLYLAFVNLFLMLLRLMGNRRS